MHTHFVVYLLGAPRRSWTPRHADNGKPGPNVGRNWRTESTTRTAQSKSLIVGTRPHGGDGWRARTCCCCCHVRLHVLTTTHATIGIRHYRCLALNPNIHLALGLTATSTNCLGVQYTRSSDSQTRGLSHIHHHTACNHPSRHARAACTAQ